MANEARTVPPPEVEAIESATGSAGTGEPAPRRSHKPLLIGGIIIVVLAAVAIYFYYRNRESTDDAQIEAHIQSVAPRVAGTVVEVDVNDNQMVHAGQVLFR